MHGGHACYCMVWNEDTPAAHWLMMTPIVETWVWGQ